jgi:lipoprotein-anchoring transpeptidase ErfK/SrfK
VVKRGKHAKRTVGRKLTVVGIVAAVALVVVGGTAFAAMRYDNSTSSEILPGIQISGVDVGGMTRTQALSAVKKATNRELQRDLKVRAGDQEWTLSPEQLGVQASVPQAVRQALAENSSLSLFSRVYHRIADKPIDATYRVPLSSSKTALEQFVEQVSRQVAQPATDAQISNVDGKLKFEKSAPGETLDAATALTALRSALRRGDASVKLPLQHVKPKVTPGNLGVTIVVDRSTNTLHLYRGFKVWKSWPVATAMPGFVTPPGNWEVVNKVENPTWVNPAPTGWGAGEPSSIPPGPGNPLGTRALYLNAPGIRIHGTPDSGSIGSYASHGCIRMTIADSEALYPLVPVGTKVVIL